MAAGSEEERVAVGRGARDGFGCDDAIGAAAGLDDHLLAERRPQALGIEACKRIGRPAGDEPDDQAHGLRGIRLGGSEGGEQRR